MSKDYETALADYMTELLSLCMEAFDGVTPAVERVYALSYADDYISGFNAFVRHQGQIKPLNFIKMKPGMYDALLHEGTQTVRTLSGICRQHGQRLPNEIRMIYDIPTGKFDASLRYDTPELIEEIGGTPCSRFYAWLEEKQIANGQKP